MLMLSTLPGAKTIRAEVLDVFEAWLDGTLTPVASGKGAGELAAVIRESNAAMLAALIEDRKAQREERREDQQAQTERFLEGQKAQTAMVLAAIQALARPQPAADLDLDPGEHVVAADGSQAHVGLEQKLPGEATLTELAVDYGFPMGDLKDRSKRLVERTLKRSGLWHNSRASRRTILKIVSAGSILNREQHLYRRELVAEEIGRTLDLASSKYRLARSQGHSSEDAFALARQIVDESLPGLDEAS
jgi:hypothetical protein